MESTPLHHKPIVYGSRAADILFFIAVVLHILPALAAPVSAIFALAAKKGGRVHVAAGRIFVWSMAAVAVTGIGVDVIRLLVNYGPNHTKYATTSDPSTIPARLGFLYAGICVLYLLYLAAPPRVWRARGEAHGLAPFTLIGAAVAFVVLIALRYNPWTGAVWMIVTFALLVVLAARTPPGVPRHRVGMAFLAAFSWWGALQGFLPGIAYAIRGIDPSTTQYVGDQPGPFTPAFFTYLVGWLPAFVIGALVVRRFRRRAIIAPPS